MYMYISRKGFAVTCNHLCFFRAHVGDKTFLDYSKDEKQPKLVVVSAIMNSDKVGNFLFRNYEYPIGRSSRYPGSMKYNLWQAVRASSAAPTYYNEYKLDEYVHTVGETRCSVMIMLPL